ncbi:MAG: ester cyclase [Bacteroidota bacterium]
MPTLTWATALSEALNAHDLDRISALYASPFVGIDLTLRHEALQTKDLYEAYSFWIEAFPDLHVRYEIMHATSRRATLVWRYTGTHNGYFLNIPPTGHVVRIEGISVVNLTDGLCSRELQIWDLAGALRSLRLLPDLPSSSRSSQDLALLMADPGV